MEELHHDERAENRERQRESRDERRRRIPEKGEDHGHDEDQRQHHRRPDVPERGANALGTLAQQREVDRRRQLRLKRRQQRLDRVGELDDVAARLAHHLQADRAGSAELRRVDPRAGPVVLDAVDDRRDLREPHGRAVPIRDDERPERRGVHELPAGLDVERRRGAEQLPRRQVHVPVLQRRIDLVDADLLRVELVRIDLHAHGVLLRRCQRDLRDPRHHRHPRRQQRLGVLVQHPRRHRRRCQPERHHRVVGRIELAKRRRRRHARRQHRHDRRDRGLHVHRGAVDVAINANCSVTLELPGPLRDVIESTPAIVVNCRSSGLATADDMMSGLPPGSPAPTVMVGKSTFGRSLTDNSEYARMPSNAIPAISRLVAIGRRMKISETFTCEDSTSALYNQRLTSEGTTA